VYPLFFSGYLLIITKSFIIQFFSMRQLGTVLFFLFLQLTVSAQEGITPTFSPGLFQYNDEITVTYDVTGTPLAGLTNAFAWVWIPGQNFNAKYNINPANSDVTKTNNAKFVKSVENGKTLFTITFTPSSVFDGDISTQTRMGILLKGNDWSNGKTTDFIADFWDGNFALKLNSPTQRPLFVNNGESIEIKAETPVPASYQLFVNNVLINSQANIKEYNFTHVATETSGYSTIRLMASANAESKEAEFQYIISESSPVVPRPAGVIPGINYKADPTKVILCVLAPGKSSAYAFGDFSDWMILPEFKMNRDGEHFWIELTGLISGQEYGYQYLIDENLRIADPYSDKILDPDDQYIPSSTYPGLKPFPEGARSDKWYFNRVSVFQTNQSAYVWQASGYQKPDKKDMVIYELHIRDFFADGNRNYQNLIDTIGYFKTLGINAVELMPIMEFSGNDSWGYNPTFMFAPDKYYGTKNKLKEFIDKCHQENIAVILDIAMNHQDTPNPYILMDFNFSTFKPNPTNPWFNVEATHPFSVFFDMNHESSYTKQYLDTVNYYWLNEFKVDGFRFDLSKGFTQKNSGGDVGAWSAKDDSRIALLKRMADRIRANFPDAILILEHLAENSEEKILADYGFLLWGNMNYAFSQNSQGFSSDSDISGASHKTRNWNDPNLIAYMESHDEERIMYRNLQTGNAAGNYSVKTLKTALDRIKASAAFYFTIPGPKMFWQFGELGYDIPIDFNGRVGAKPIKWDYYNNPDRLKLFKTFSNLISLKKQYDVFETTDISIQGGNTLQKQITLRNTPYTTAPASAAEMNVHLIGNFDVTAKSINATFPHAGKWYHYFSNGDSLVVTNATTTITLMPGEFRLYTDVKLPPTERELMAYVKPYAPELVSLEEGNGKVTLSWIDNSSVETEYNIFRRESGGDFEKVGTAGPSEVIFMDHHDLEALVTYEYYIEAANNGGRTASNTLSIVTTEIITSIESSHHNSIKVFPNPAMDKLQISGDQNIITDVSLISTRGEAIKMHPLSPWVWDISQLPAGLYIVCVKTSGGIVNTKLIKQ
jgi:1,4-alpha-glucan branching enzyme